MSRTGATLETSFAASSIPATMRAAVYRGKGRVVVEDVPVPRIAAGEVLIRVAACGICGTDLKKIEHGFVAAPQIFGHEVSGSIVALGAGVTQWKLGDRVMSFHHIPCGTCFYCDRRLYSQCGVYKKVGLTAGFDPNGGGFAQYVRAMPWVAQLGMVAIPDEISFEEATFIEPANTCIKAVEKARVSTQETVLVMGQGPIGLLLTMLSKLAGAFVIGSDPMPERRAKSLSLGADLALDPREGRIADDSVLDLDLLHDGEPEALGGAALQLALHRLGVDRLADVLCRRELDHLHQPELGVDVDDGAMRGEGVLEVGVGLPGLRIQAIRRARMELSRLLDHLFPEEGGQINHMCSAGRHDGVVFKARALAGLRLATPKLRLGESEDSLANRLARSLHRATRDVGLARC